MSIDYRPIVGVGKYFEDEREAQDWYEGKVDLDEEYFVELEDDGLTNFLENNDGSGLEGSFVNSYSCEGYYLYIPIEAGNATSAITGIQTAIKIWFDKFGEEPAFIADIMVY